MLKEFKRSLGTFTVALGSLLCLAPTQFNDIKQSQVYPNDLRRHFEAVWIYLSDVVDKDNGKTEK